MWILSLNDMRCNSEHHQTVARAETKEQLLAFLQTETVEPYMDEAYNQFCESNNYKYRKYFRKSGPLEWFNQADESNPFFRTFTNMGTLEDYLQSATNQWNTLLAKIPLV
jgi:hypothetical protein